MGDGRPVELLERPPLGGLPVGALWGPGGQLTPADRGTTEQPSPPGSAGCRGGLVQITAAPWQCPAGRQGAPEFADVEPLVDRLAVGDRGDIEHLGDHVGGDGLADVPVRAGHQQARLHGVGDPAGGGGDRQEAERRHL